MRVNPACSNPPSLSVEAIIEEVVARVEEALAQAVPAGCGTHGDSLARLREMYGQPAVLPPAAEAPRKEQAADTGAAARKEQAEQLVQDGGLNSPAVQPPPSQQELDQLAGRINAADDDAAVQIARDPRAMALATPQQKAALVRKLMSGHTNGDEEQAIKQILLSCTSREELDQVIQMSGGFEEISDELEKADLRQILGHANALAQKQDAAFEQALTLLELARTPAEFDALYEKFGGEALKHKLPKPPRPETLERLDALGQKYGVAGVGFGLPPEKTIALQAALQKAIDAEDNDAIVQLSENSEAMKAASPLQKARLIAILQDGWTKDRQDMAIARILTSCASKAEFDRVVDLAGGPKVIEDVDFAEAKADINKLMGGFDRIDCAGDKATAQAYQGVLMPPAVETLTSTRPPTDAELGAVGGEPPAGSRDDAETRQRVDQVRNQMGRAAHDVQGDPQARNKLALVNRERQLNGQPPLDYTSLVTQAYQVVHDPAFAAEVDQIVAATEKQLGKLDNQKKQEIREQVLAQRLGDVAKQHGLSEQDLKTLVTTKMGRVLQEGAGALRAVSTDPATRVWADQLQATGATVANLFKVPPSFAEDLVSALSVIADVLATVVNVIPGVGQAISGAYFGIKAIVGFATGDILGAFKSLLSAVPGFSGILGAAGAVINTGAKVVQAGIAAGEGIASGNPLALAGAVGGIAGNLGVDLNKFVPGGELVQGALKHGVAVGGIVDGVARGDINAVLGAALPNELRALGAGALADQLDAVGRSPAAQAFRATVEQVGDFVGAVNTGDADAVGNSLRKWVPQLATHSASRAIGGLADQANRLLGSFELDQANKQGFDAARESQRILTELAALKNQIGAVRRFEDAALTLKSLGNSGDWQALGAEMLRQLGVR